MLKTLLSLFGQVSMEPHVCEWSLCRKLMLRWDQMYGTVKLNEEKEKLGYGLR